MTPDEAAANLLAHIPLADLAGEAAANGMVAAYDRGIKSNELVRTTGHPSAPGSPPALESGRLRGSFRIRAAFPVGAHRYKSSDAPNTIYAVIQETGGDIWAKHTYRDKRTGITKPGFLRWGGPGGFHYARHVRLPKRPYVKPAVERMRSDGTLERGAAHAFEDVMHW